MTSKTTKTTTSLTAGCIDAARTVVLCAVTACSVDTARVDAREAPPAPAPPALAPLVTNEGESDSACRRFAPELPDPKCCHEFSGLDPDVVLRACGLDVYLGQSQHFTCGHYFHHPRGDEVWFRTSAVPEATAQIAASTQARNVEAALGIATNVAAVPFLDNASWVLTADTGWAFVDTPRHVQRLTWTRRACSDDGMKIVLTAWSEAHRAHSGTKAGS